MENSRIKLERKSIERLINRILLNPYVGLLLLIKDGIEFLEWLQNSQKTEIKMNSSLIINVVIDLLIAFVIYSILQQYKNKANKHEIEIIRLNQKMFNTQMKLLLSVHNKLIMNLSISSPDNYFEFDNQISNNLSILSNSKFDDAKKVRSSLKNLILNNPTCQLLAKESDEEMKKYGLTVDEIQFIRDISNPSNKDKE